MAIYFKRLFVFAVLCLICFFYYSLKDIPIRIWDEAIYSNNAIEMARSHNYLVLTNNGHPSYYNTKPPMAIWLESLSINVFGINEFSIRLPSMLAVIATFIGLIYFLHKNRFPLALQFFSVLTLLTSPGYMGMHVAATGDLDALLVMWTSFFAFSMFDLIVNSPQHLSKRIWMAGFFFLCAFFTKSTAALLIIPGSLVVLLLFADAYKIIVNKHFFFVLLLSFGLITALCDC
jgi:4-amino-4-deoxy-L-arabinose transferase-like glycosyltransferase